MRKSILLLAFVCFLSLACRDKRMSIEEYAPQSTLNVPQHLLTRAKYPFIDVHTHYDALMPRDKLDQLVKELDSINLRTAVNLSGGTGEKLKAGVENMKGAYFDIAGYKNIDQPTARKKIIEKLGSLANFNEGVAECMLRSVDALDAVVCLVAARDFLMGTAMRPDNRPLAEIEGWIWCHRPQYDF
jgi:hypothetical protein